MRGIAPSIACWLLCCALAAGASEPTPSPARDVIGDANGDGGFDGEDVSFLRRALRGRDSRRAQRGLGDVARPCDRVDREDLARIERALRALEIRELVSSNCHGAPIGSPLPDEPRFGPGPTTDAHFLAIAEAVPGFGGFHLDGEDAAVVQLRESTEEGRDAAARMLRERFGEGRFEDREVRVEVVAFDFATLHASRRAAESLLGVAGAVFVDTDERANRVTIGVPDPEETSGLESALGSLGVPLEQVRFVRSGALKRLNHQLPAQLEKRTRPVHAGLRIVSDDGDQCSLGFLARRQGVSGLVTARHCTKSSSNVFRQGPNQVANPIFASGPVRPNTFTEAQDPRCDFDAPCLIADAAFVPLLPGEAARRGLIKQYHHGTAGNVELAQVGGAVVSGQGLFAQGASTGQHGGEVVHTDCAGIMDDGTILLYFSFLDAEGADEGDSGGPIFSVDSQGGAGLWGVLSGHADGAGVAFGNMNHVFEALGPMDRILYGNDPPEIEITSPNSGAVFATSPFDEVQFSATFWDTESGAGCPGCKVEWTSLVDGPLGTTSVGTGVGQSDVSTVLTGPPGPRTIKAKATDGDGATAFDLVYITLGNLVPVISIDAPSDGSTLYRGIPYVFEQQSFDGDTFDAVPCGAIEWSSSEPADDFGKDCNPTVTFTANGPRTVSVTATDSDGGVGTGSASYVVQDLPGISPPIVTILSPANKAGIERDAKAALRAVAFDDAAQLELRWHLVTPFSSETLGTATRASGATWTLGWTPADHVPDLCGGTVARLRLTATPPVGHTPGHKDIEVWIQGDPC